MNMENIYSLLPVCICVKTTNICKYKRVNLYGVYSNTTGERDGF